MHIVISNHGRPKLKQESIEWNRQHNNKRTLSTIKSDKNRTRTTEKMRKRKKDEKSIKISRLWVCVCVRVRQASMFVCVKSDLSRSTCFLSSSFSFTLTFFCAFCLHIDLFYNSVNIKSMLILLV